MDNKDGKAKVDGRVTNEPARPQVMDAAKEGSDTNSLMLMPQGFDQSVVVSAEQEFGYLVGGLRKGDKLMLQYQYGKWKAWGTVPSESPDSQVIEGGDKCRLVICAVLINGKSTVLVVVPAGTKDQPFEWVADQDYEKIILRINDDGDFASNPDGGVQYRLRLLPASARNSGFAVLVPPVVLHEHAVSSRQGKPPRRRRPCSCLL